MSNLKQLAFATLSYVNDFTYFPLCGPSGKLASGSEINLWSHTLGSVPTLYQDYLGGKLIKVEGGNYNRIPNTLYRKSDVEPPLSRVFACPSNQAQNFPERGYSYGMMGGSAANYPMNPERLMKLQQWGLRNKFIYTTLAPALWYDRAAAHLNNIEVTNHPLANSPYPAGGNVSMVDGSVRWAGPWNRAANNPGLNYIGSGYSNPVSGFCYPGNTIAVYSPAGKADLKLQAGSNNVIIGSADFDIFALPKP